VVSSIDMLDTGAADTLDLLAMAAEEDDEAALADLEGELAELLKVLEKLEFRRMFSGEMDANNAFLDIQAGSGGTEAQDWAEMLLRMYLRWAESRGFKTELMEVSPGEVAGIKSATIFVQRRSRLRLAAHRDRRAPAGAQVAVRLRQPPPYLLRLGVRLARDRRLGRDRDQSGGPAHRRLPGLRCRRPARQQDGLRRAHHALPPTSSPSARTTAPSTRTRTRP
jgi:hypothetical protein